MDELILPCQLITPMFSFGVNQSEPEIRPTEIKGLMRYTYRIVCPADVKTLRQDEAALFGGAAQTKSDNLHASPLRLSVSYTRPPLAMQPILLHKDYVDLRFTKNLQKFDPRNCLEPATQFCITLRLNQTIQQDFKVSIDWYKDLLMLSLLLGGLGKRSRKGRGCVELTNSEALALQDRSAAIDWICRTLNKIAQTSTENLPPTIYQRQESIIQSTIALPSVNNRPVIQTIYFGAAMKVSLLNEYLTTVDHYCHKLKDDELSLPGKRDAKLNKAITGEGSPRFASPLIISVIKLNEQFMPVYTAVRAVNGTNTIDLDCSQRTAFINLIENTMKRK